MPLIWQKHSGPMSSIGLWRIQEDISFFKRKYKFPEKLPTHPARKSESYAARLTLKTLMELHNCPFSGLKKKKNGQPYIPGSQSLFSSLSHSSQYALAGINTSPIGVDIERIDPRLQKLRHKFLSEEECPYEDPISLCICWTAKETAYKYFGHHLKNDQTLNMKKDLKIRWHDEKLYVKSRWGQIEIIYFGWDQHIISYSL
ncbi:MAG: 4'-phosphopantetheinyl transferase superfamily protein [Cytophagales bacterium]|nr:4'-phosphopantetheinyl transferase superfamily protein [Cytophagales bacterium]